MLCLLNHHLRDEPGIEDAIIRINKDSLTSIRFTPAGDVRNFLKVITRLVIYGLRCSREYFHSPVSFRHLWFLRGVPFASGLPNLRWNEKCYGASMKPLNIVLVGEESAGIQTLKLVCRKQHTITAVVTSRSDTVNRAAC